VSTDPPDDPVTATRERPAAGLASLWDLIRTVFGRPPEGPPPGAVPARIGRYKVLALLGEGGMGRVFLAEDEDLRRRVAVKTLKGTDESSRSRFTREAQAAARVSHPHVCPIFDVGKDGGEPFLAMELLAGETLAQRLKRGGPRPPTEALEIVQQLLAALGAVHGSGIVHRDVKPSNVFLTAHGAKLLDFGLAREVPKDVAHAFATQSGSALPGLITGTPGYMAPEQILGHAVDSRADLFAAAVVLYEMLVGRQPFPGDSPVRALSAALYEEPPPLVGSPALERLDGAVRKALAKHPDQRYGSAADMAHALRLAWREDAPAPSTPLREVFAGRQAELLALDERLAAAVAGTGSVVFVTGERGVGKSSLAGEFLRRVRSGPGPVTVVSGRCVEPRGPGEAFLPFLDALGRLLVSRGGKRAAELVRAYAPTVGVQMPSGLLADPDGALHHQAVGATKERLIREAGDFIEAASRDFPILMYLEDLQWADAPSVDLLHHLGYRISRQRILILGTYRHADVDATGAPIKRCALDLVARGVGREITLGPFSDGDLQSYLDARFSPNDFPESLARAVHARTEGLALFARSLVDLLHERGEIRREGERWRLARPVEEVDLEPTKGLQDLVRQQLEALPERERDVLRHASVCGREFLTTVVAHLVGGDEVEIEEILRQVCQVRRLTIDHGEEEMPDGALATRYRFTHGLYQSALYQDLVPARRVQLHRQVAERLRRHGGEDAPGRAAEIAQHCELGRDFTGAVEFRRRAGENEARRYAWEEAADHYEWAWRLVEKLPAEERPAAQLALLARRGAVRHAQARFDEAADTFWTMREAAREARSLDAEQAALAALCDTLFFARRVDEMAVRAGELLETAARAGRPEQLTEARSRLGQVLVCEGRLRDGAPLLDEVVAAARAGGPPIALQTALGFRGLIHYWQTEYEAADACCAEAAALAADRGDGFTALGIRLFVGLARVSLGRVGDGLRVFKETIDVVRRNGDRFWLPRLVSQLGFVHRELFALERARELDTEGLRLAQEKPGPWAPKADSLLNLCVDDVRVGNIERAAATLAELEAQTAQSPWLRWMNELRLETAAAEHWVARRDWEHVVERADRLGEVADRLGARGYRCTAERHRLEAALARDTGVEEGVARLAAAREALRSFRAPFETWKAGRLLGLGYRRLGDAERARRAFAEAADDVRSIAAGVGDEKLREGFLAAAPVREVLEAARADEGPARS
jgi:tetratricopeptide (TPR) repeat protein